MVVSGLHPTLPYPKPQRLHIHPYVPLQTQVVVRGLLVESEQLASLTAVDTGAAKEDTGLDLGRASSLLWRPSRAVQVGHAVV